MVLAKHAIISSREWRGMKDYHPEGYPFRASLKKDEYDYWTNPNPALVPIDDINEQLKKWRIGFKYEYNPKSNRWDTGVSVRAYFFRTVRELMRMRLTFAEHITETYQCRPRSQIEAERRRDYRKKGKKDKTIMLTATQLLSARAASKDEDEDS